MSKELLKSLMSDDPPEKLGGRELSKNDHHLGYFIGPNRDRYLATGFNNAGWPNGEKIEDQFPEIVEEIKKLSVDGIHGKFMPNLGAFAPLRRDEYPFIFIEDKGEKIEIVLAGHCLNSNSISRFDWSPDATYLESGGLAPPYLDIYSPQPQEALKFIRKHFGKGFKIEYKK